MELKHNIQKILKSRLFGPLNKTEDVLQKSSAQPESISKVLESPEFEYISSGWEYVHDHPEVKGWNVEDILQVYLNQWVPFVKMAQSSGPLSGIHESVRANVTIEGHNSIMIFAYALGLAA